MTHSPVLPYEILELVFNQARLINHERHGFRRLRLVSKAINSFVEPHVFASLRLSFADRTETIPDILEGLVSGTSPHIRHARRLLIVPDAHTLNDDDIAASFGYHYSRTVPAELKDSVVDVQSRLLLPAVRSLESLEHAELECPCWDTLTGEILSALSHLPVLRGLYLSKDPFTHPLSLVDLPQAPFSNIESISVSCSEEDLVPWTGLQKLLSITKHRLSSLSLEITSIDAPPIDLGLVFTAAGGSGAIGKTLKKLTITKTGIRLTDSCVPFLRSLTSLHLRMGTPTTSSFWTALEESRIHLRVLELFASDVHSMQYIRSYTGLEELILDVWSEVPQDVEPLAVQFIQYALPKHATSLKKFHLGPKSIATWIWSNSTLDAFGGCKALEDLLVAISVPASNEKAELPLDHILRFLLDALPSLHTLRIDLEYNPPPAPATPRAEVERRFKLGIKAAAFVVTNEEFPCTTARRDLPRLLLADCRAAPRFIGVPGRRPATRRYESVGIPRWKEGEMEEAAREWREMTGGKEV